MDAIEGRTALVTGASRGIGAAIALTLAREGANVVLTYASTTSRAADVVAQIEALGRRAVAIQADSGDPAAVTAAVDAAAATFGGLDILVNNAGVVVLGPLEKMTLADIDRTFTVNVRATIVATQAAVRHMTSGGRIITIGSNVADRVPGPGGSIYAASKSALAGLTRGLAHEFGPRGITAVVVQPGPTDTDANPAHGPHAEQTIARTPLRRYGQVDDIAKMVAFLAGPGGRHVTGTTITLDGGFNA
ncbi:3-oxoacyl-ACP reductase family protein [Amycolatopsis mongoliensis]|uniref:3-oxoacyl-ACP reductase family protein n=1 Tax=Amycolatopsis mongoliensis TaxID=715475 RepID=A0A9Y2JH97_9PSEU|nr:3-oxoacyl-ACP reductase family protein [Amycolatopsis sp. 4-36]WIX98452.1 3-oxoacyl-ACP reductase family protein [Amycolatopsis sp. 4-36]